MTLPRTKNEPAPPLLLSVGEATQKLGIGRATLYRMFSAQEIASLTIRRRRLIPAAAIDRYIRERAA